MKKVIILTLLALTVAATALVAFSVSDKKVEEKSPSCCSQSCD